MRLRFLDGRPDLDLEDPALGLTPAQRDACAIGRDILVRAGAGVGKTYTLSIRYLRLMVREAWDAVLRDPHDPRPDIDRVLVLTFTDKAAREMSSRCRARLLELSRALGTRPEGFEGPWGLRGFSAFKASVRVLLDAFEGARISTFHAFCARVLREFPAETGAPPGFEVLDADDAQDLAVEATDRGILAWLDEDAEGTGLLLDALGGRHAMSDAILALLSRREFLEDRLRGIAKGRIDPLDWISQVPISPEQALLRVQDALLPILRSFLAIMREGPRTGFVERAETLVKELFHPPSDPIGIYVAYGTLLDLLLPDGKARVFSYHGVMGKIADWKALGLGHAHKPAREALDVLRADLGQHVEWADARASLPTRLDATLALALRPLAALACRCLDLYREELARRGLLDFSELQWRLSRAMSGASSLAQVLSERHHHVMVDEFQDTDGLQWAILTAIARPLGRSEGRLFLVGDPQQAIYGFRGGDVTVFSAVERDMREHGLPPIELARNFRSRPGLIGWFNAVFHPILGDPSPARPPWEASYQALEVGRGLPGGTVTRLVHEHPKGAEAALADAQAVRSLLVDEILPPGGLLASLSLLDHEKHPSPPVAILIRRRTHLALLEHQLRLARVPHVFQGGIGFWDRQEVLDVANTLHALCLNDAISLVGALRSPLFGLSDDAIHALSRAGGLHGFGPARRYPGEPTESAVWEPAVEEARRRWMTLRALRHRLPPSRFLCMLYETCDAAALAWRQDENGQAWANLLRLLDLAGRYDAMGGRGIPAFTRRLLDRINQGSREEQASIAANEARVVLLTVHAAKGLEFPVVILPDLSAGPRGETGGLVIGRLASDWHFATLVPDTSASALGRASPGLREALRDRLGREREAEDLRLFYVACTRACDHLFLVGGRPPPPKDRQASGWVGLLDAVGWGRVADPVDDVLHELPPPQEPFSVLPLPPRDLPLPDPRRLADAAPLDLSCLHDVSPSGIDLFAECPARWMRARHLGIPELARGPIERGKELAALRGSVIHALLEEDALDDISSARRRWLGEARALGANDEEIDRGLGIVLAHLRKARQDEALHALRTAEGWNELRFRLPIGDLVLQGTIDRLCRPVGSEGWLVLDYKSTRATGHVEEVTRKYRRQMLTYALAAATLLGAPLPNGVRAALYFTEPGVLCLLPPWHEQEIADLEGLLKCMGAILKGARTWVEVEGEATRSPRPCATCGYRGRGCRGARRIPGDPNRDEIAD